MNHYSEKNRNNFRTDLLRELVHSVDPYADGYWIERFRCFLREKDWRYTRKHDRNFVHFDFFTAVKLEDGFFRFDVDEMNKFKEKFIGLANSHISKGISHMWDYILGFDPFLDDHEQYVENFGLDHDFFSSPRGRWMLENMKRLLSREVVHEMNIRNKHSWHINEILTGDLSPQERHESLSFRKPDLFAPRENSRTRQPGEYVEAVLLKIIRLIRRLQYPTHRNSPLFSLKDPENFSFLNSDGASAHPLSSRGSMVCDHRDIVIIMNEDLFSDLSRYKDLKKLKYRILTVKTLPYECIKIGSKYRYNKLHVNKNLKTKLLDQNRKIEFLYRHFFNFFLRNDVPFMALKIFGIRDKISLAQ